MGDPARLRQVLLNLVGNALKFTEEGGVLIETDVEASSGEQVTVHFRVTDTGIGIAPKKRELIFDPFTQAEDSTTRRFGGTGLGLAISSQLVKLMGGRIWVTDGPGGLGSSFHVTVPFEVTGGASAGEKPIAQPVANQLNILLAEDNPVNQLVAIRMLERDRHLVRLVRNGLEALEAVEREEFDLVLMDLEMPQMDGLEATRRIRSREAFCASSAENGGPRRLPIMAMTANASKSDEARCMGAGMDGFLTKPFTAEKLRLAIENLHCTPIANVTGHRSRVFPRGAESGQ
jgi:CheY-like chemotaxis protein